MAAAHHGWLAVGGLDGNVGAPNFAPSCTLPLTGRNVVVMIVTDLVFERPDHDAPFRLIEMAPGVAVDELASKTAAGYLS